MTIADFLTNLYVIMNLYKKLTKYFLLLLLSSFIIGCAGYSFNPTTPLNIESVALSPIINKTSEPAIEHKLTEAVKSYIQLDGRLILENVSDADAVIEITLTKYRNNPIAYRTDTREISTENYLQGVHASAVMISTKTGEIIAETINHGESIYNFESDLASSKRNVFSSAADELARMLYTDLIEQW